MVVIKKVDAPKSAKGVSDLFASATLASDTISSTHTDELVIALCGPIGSPLHEVADTFKSLITGVYGYEECRLIRLSDFISEYSEKVDIVIPEAPGMSRITKQIDAGNALRTKYGRSVLAELAVNSIRLDRQAQKVRTGEENFTSRRVCHIIDSIKNQEELDLLRMVYREMLYVVGVFSPMDQRELNLIGKGLTSGEVYTLVDRDSGEESNDGQTVRDTFPQSDFFLRSDTGTGSQRENRVKRFLDLILGAQIVTPTEYESAMYAAASAASRSACLSRQVGAAVLSKDGEILAVGWNDVPKFGGGLYIEDANDPSGSKDKRCWNFGAKCFNDSEKDLFAVSLIELLNEVIPLENREAARSKIRDAAKLKGLIEFSRSIHAEMHALLNAGRVAGGRIDGGTLFVTTYPCHSCARHIVASGIETVYFIEPYRKSLAIKLHGDSISERETDPNKVRLLPSDGVAPSRYLDLFKVPMDSRKKGGVLNKLSPKDAHPRLEKSLQAVPELESMVVRLLMEQRKLIAQETTHE